jgi:hypothetical protein
MGNILKTKGGLVIDRPGNVLFVPVKADGSLDYSNAIRNTAVINTITVTNSKTKTEIPDGNSFYPAGDRVTAIAGTVAVDFSTVDPAIWAMCSGTSLKTTATDTMLKIYDYQKISENSTIELSEKYKDGAFVQVIGTDGTTYEKVTGDTALKQGEFKIAVAEGSNKTTITFSSDDKEKDVAISMMTETKTISYSQGRTAMKYHKIIIDTEYSTLNDTEKVPVNVVVSQASVSGDMVDSLQKDPSATKTLTFNMYAPLAGEQPYEIKFKDSATE